MDNIAEIIRRAKPGLRRPSIDLPIIFTTVAQEDRLAAQLVGMVRYWQQGFVDVVAPAYASSLSEAEHDAGLTRDSATEIEQAIASLNAGAVAAIATFSEWFREWSNEITTWHWQKLISSLKYATGVDLDAIIGPADINQTLGNVLARNVGLIRNISDTMRSNIGDIVFRNLSARAPLRTVAKEISEAAQLQRKRALRIASDQTVKLAATLDQERQEQLGITEFLWRHSGKVHYRPEHLARNGKVYKWRDNKLGTDLPGFLPFCGCKAQAHIDLEGE